MAAEREIPDNRRRDVEQRLSAAFGARADGVRPGLLAPGRVPGGRRRALRLPLLAAGLSSAAAAVGAFTVGWARAAGPAPSTGAAAGAQGAAADPGFWSSGVVAAAWVVVALLLLGFEVLSLDLVALMLAGGAFGAALAAGLGAPLWADIAVAVAVSLAGLLLVRPVALRHLRQGPEQRTGTAALVGRSAEVLAAVDDGDGGRVKLAGEVWSARVYLPGSRVEPGRSVEVMSIDGAIAVVHPLELPWSP